MFQATTQAEYEREALSKGASGSEALMRQAKEFENTNQHAKAVKLYLKIGELDIGFPQFHIRTRLNSHLRSLMNRRFDESI